jgi:hypothetical protein
MNNMYLVLSDSFPELPHVIDLDGQMRTQSPLEKMALKPANTPSVVETITLANVLDRLRVDPTLSPQRSRDLTSAIQTFARLTERDPAHLHWILHRFGTRSTQ